MTKSQESRESRESRDGSDKGNTESLNLDVWRGLKETSRFLKQESNNLENLTKLGFTAASEIIDFGSDEIKRVNAELIATSGAGTNTYRQSGALRTWSNSDGRSIKEDRDKTTVKGSDGNTVVVDRSKKTVEHKQEHLTVTQNCQSTDPSAVTLKDRELVAGRDNNGKSFARYRTAGGKEIEVQNAETVIRTKGEIYRVRGDSISVVRDGVETIVEQAPEFMIANTQRRIGQEDRQRSLVQSITRQNCSPHFFSRLAATA